MDYLVICLTAFLGAGLTFFSGFGLGTLLTPVFAVFFSLDIAIALTAIVHFLNNIFKLILVGKHIDKMIIVRFGAPAIIFALLGAYMLTFLSDVSPIAQYNLWGKLREITPVKLIIALLLIIFSLFEIIPKLSNLKFNEKYIPLGGALSGFFGGLSGNQGALRSAFLLRANLSKETFIATGVAIACMIDVARLAIYTKNSIVVSQLPNYNLLIVATLSAFAGAYLGNKFLKKITIQTLQYTVAFMLILFSVLLALGIA
ncbi:MAG: sulfite exporter TauE/SafE family protein [Bacteroidia bacterium]